MSESPGHEEDIDTAINGIAIILLRIYDTNMAILAKLDPDAANMLEQLHDAGKLLGAPPYAAEQPFVSMEDEG